MSITIEGIVIKKLFDKNDFKIYSVLPNNEYLNLLSVDAKYGTISITGTMPPLVEKDKYKFEIENSDNAKYPNSYKIVRLLTDNVSVEAYQDEFLKTQTTERQYETLKKNYPNIVDMLINDKEIDVSCLHGIGDATIKRIRDKVKKEYPLVELIGKYHDLGLSLPTLKKIFEFYGSVKMVDTKIQEDPYGTLVALGGIGFKRADFCLLKKYPQLRNSKTRCIGAVSYLLKQNETNGNTYMTFPNLYRQLMELAPESNSHFRDCLDSEVFYYHKESNRVSLKETYNAEREVCNRLLLLNKNRTIWNFDYNKYNMVGGFPLSEEQMQILKDILENDVCILTGSGGTGKTFSTKALLDMLEDNRISYTLFSPTGKASKVLSENTGRKTSTIHRGLGVNRGSKDYKLSSKVVLIDEFGMIDIFLMRDLLRAIDDGTKLVFVGDASQLPSVGAGNVAYDMITSGIFSRANLTKVFRFEGGGLAYVTTLAREGKYYLKSQDQIQVMGEDSDYMFVNCEDGCLDVVRTLYKKLLTQYKAKPGEIAILSSYNNGEYGVNNINNMIQEIVNPQVQGEEEITINKKVKDKEFEITFRKYDIVMQLTNKYAEKDPETHEKIGEDVFNGDMGYIERIEDGVAFVNFDGYVAEYSKTDLRDLNLGYSYTLHRSQGSSINYVLLLTPSSHTYFLNRNLLYVGLSRSRKLTWQIGSFKTIKSALRKSENLARDTFLSEMLIQKI